MRVGAQRRGRDGSSLALLGILHLALEVREEACSMSLPRSGWVWGERVEEYSERARMCHSVIGAGGGLAWLLAFSALVIWF